MVQDNAIPCNTMQYQSNWISNSDDLKISCQVLSPQATLPAHHNDVDLVVNEGQLRKSGQDSELLLITLSALHRVHKLVSRPPSPHHHHHHHHHRHKLAPPDSSRS